MKRKPSRRKEKPQPKVKEPFVKDKTKQPFQSDTSFFQAKLKIGSPNDQAEKEADNAADKVVNMQNKSVSENSVQKQTEKEEPKAKLIQAQEEKEKPEAKLIHRQAEEEEPKAKLIQKQDEKEEPKAKLIQTQEEKEKPEAKLIQKQSEEEPKAKLIQKQDKKEDEVQKKTSLINQSNKSKKENTESKTSTFSRLNEMINKTKGKGKQLPDNIRGELEAKFRADFSMVRIHTDKYAIEMTSQINAQAFAHGYDIYFNKGKYNPGTTEGKHLLAHELSHIIQQKGYGK